MSGTGFNACEAPGTATEMERDGVAFYEALAGAVKDEKAEELALDLAEQEKDHIRRFREMIDAERFDNAWSVDDLVDFYGTWCAPCIEMKPMLEELAKELEGRASIMRAEITDLPETAGRYDVMSVPTLMLFSGGEAKATLTGTPSKAEIQKSVESHLGT